MAEDPKTGPKDRKEPARTVFEASTPPTGPEKAKRRKAGDAATVVHSQPPKPVVNPSAFAALSNPGAATGRIGIGSVLNHIYEVTRFIGRGGMGEVYEGINVNTDERVAIKVILPHLAQDPNVQAMFRKEARTLTRLSHPALVQYRVLAVEPQLAVLYIVTEFVDGVGLDEVLGELKPSDDQLLALMKRLAEGLRLAHDLGAIHRDISPDNILLPGGRLESATIIDFGIAKDLDSTQATIVGDGFAGKLGFVAPEQFGDFGREIGPWTDVYSLGLVMLSVAAGKPVDMGATLVQAVDSRRAGPDLSPLSEPLRPLFKRMLTADPKARMRSMDELLLAIADLRRELAEGPAAPTAEVVAAPAPEPEPTPQPEPEPAPPAAAAATAPPIGPMVEPGAQPARKPPIGLIAAGLVALVVAGVAAAMMMSKPAAKANAPAAAASAPAATTAESAAPAVSTLKPAIEAKPAAAVIPPAARVAKAPARAQRAEPRPAPAKAAAKPAAPKPAKKDDCLGCY
jgi:tRNA A-37 threonylcarbamoyl transferase component Bud32